MPARHESLALQWLRRDGSGTTVAELVPDWPEGCGRSADIGRGIYCIAGAETGGRHGTLGLGRGPMVRHDQHQLGGSTAGQHRRGADRVDGRYEQSDGLGAGAAV